jgi:signal transduction histidine kinase/CheY-like chemotaxis protein/AraC-like DNA-binding protein/ligand-binding sensor domain-containing protein
MLFSYQDQLLFLPLCLRRSPSAFVWLVLTMFKKLSLSLLLCGWFLSVNGFTSNDTLKSYRELGNPYILDPAPEVQGRAPQNFFIWQSSKKIIYIGNQGHLLEYDGTTWKKTDMHGERIVGMEGDHSDTIYAATDYNFGYFNPDASRQLVFTSLLELLPADYRENLKMKSCFVGQDGVYFIARRFILFRSHTGQIKIQPAQTDIKRAFKIGNDFYALQEGIGLTRISANEQIRVPGSEFLSGENVIGIFKQEDGSLLMCTQVGKFYRYDGASFRPVFSIDTKHEINYRCYQPVVQLPDGRFAFAMRTQGILLFDKTGAHIASINKSTGLRHNLVNALLVDQDGSLWAALDNGVNRIEVSSPFTFLDERAGLESAVLRIVRHKGTLHFGTMTGLYRHRSGRPDFIAKLQEDFNASVWDLYSDDQVLLAATTFGLYLVTDDKLLLLTHKDHYCRSILRSRKYKDIFYVSSLTGIFVIKRIAEKKWEVIKEINFSNSFIDELNEDANGDVWGSAYNGGYYRIIQPADENHPDVEPIVKAYDLSHGLQIMSSNHIFKVKGTLLFGSGNKLLQYDEQRNRFVEQHIIKDKKGIFTRQVIRMNEDGNGNIYIDLSFEDKNRIVILDKTGEPISRPYFSRLENITLFDILLDQDSICWIGGPAGITRVDLRLLKRDRMPSFETMVRGVILNRDSVLFGGYDTTAYRIVLPYQQSNMLRFEFGAPSFDQPAETQFQYFLEGYDDDWSDWSAAEGRKDYTNLREGRYRIHVRAKNIYNVTGKEATLEVTILPPWYRTWWAYLLYSLAAVFVVRAIVQWRLRQLSREKNILEQIVSDRTKELAHKNVQLEEQAQELLTLDTLKSRFFANISHEFRTPLTLILGPLEQYFASRGEKMPGEAALSMMYRNSKRLHQLIDQLLYITKLESGYTRLIVVQDDIHHFIKTILSGFDALADQKKITYHYSIPEGTSSLFFDADKLEKILYNLLSNAFKFTREDGAITVTLACSPDGRVFTSPGDPAAQWIQITVQDSGIGIPEAGLPKIFDRFYQVDASDTSEFSGTGIGLSLVKELVKLYGGTIGVTSKMGEGSCFTVTLPVSKYSLPQHEVTDNTSFSRTVIDPDLLPPTEEYDVDEEIPEEENPDGKITVLIAEDNPDMRQYIQHNLNDLYNCVTAVNGREGMEKAITLIPDLIIADVMMPEMNGLELCHHLKTDERTSHIPVIMLTAKADLSSRIEGLKTGADDYLSKPFDVEELKLRIRNLIARRDKLRERYRKEVRIEPSGVTATSLEEIFLAKIVAIVEDNLAEPDFNVDDFAAKAGISRAQLHRKLKALTGQSSGDFIRSFRLKRAAQLLEKNSDFIAQIGYQVGFSDQSYFTKCFRKQFGMSPSVYISQKSAAGTEVRL